MKVSLINPEACFLNCLSCQKNKKSVVLDVLLKKKPAELLVPLSLYCKRQGAFIKSNCSLLFEKKIKAIDYNKIREPESQLSFAFIFKSFLGPTHDYFVRLSGHHNDQMDFLKKISGEKFYYPCKVIIPVSNLNLLEAERSVRFFQKFDLVTSISVVFSLNNWNALSKIYSETINPFIKILKITNYRKLTRLLENLINLKEKGFKIREPKEKLVSFLRLLEQPDKLMKEEDDFYCLAEKALYQEDNNNETGELRQEAETSTFTEEHLKKRVNSIEIRIERLD